MWRELIAIRQGDVILVRIEVKKIPLEGFRRQSENPLTILGENGHKHEIFGARQVMVAERPRLDLNLPVLSPQARVVGLVEAGPNTQIVHNGHHAPVSIPDGFWLVLQQQEYQGRQRRASID